MITMESMLDYNVKEALKRFKRQMETTATGEELQEELWQHRELFGEIMLEVIQESLGDEIFE